MCLYSSTFEHLKSNIIDQINAGGAEGGRRLVGLLADRPAVGNTATKGRGAEQTGNKSVYVQFKFM